MTEADILNERIDRSGYEFGSHYHHLWRELGRLHKHWCELRMVYGQGHDVIDLVNATAPDYFVLATNAQWKDIIMTLGAFADPPSTKVKRQLLTNLSFRGLYEQMDADGKRLLLPMIVRFEKAMKPIELMRNKLLAHWDAEIWLTKGSPTVTPEQVGRCLGHAVNLMKFIAKRQEFGFWDFTDQKGFEYGTKALLFYLRMGLEKARAEEQPPSSASVRARALNA